MIDIPQGVQLAEEFLASNPGAAEVPLVVDRANVTVHDGFLVVPCNSEEFLRTERFEHMVIGCTPVRVDLKTGECRFLTLDETMKFDL
ncbi:hypothetical protein GCM10012286_64530 [Streptomyces lasiicapitis]|uniref:Uncharacterized protein n=1 Tax=Streptomyces lasiicapitis TaxID=1923961 RepID=A0ABQ2MMF0_9ACTN|nr:hypothetical protein GCM10012286_64530 [Streptomyces lasiicapitis]